ncbi:hypothetical protein AB3B00_002325 [Vibrio alginolyticus]
MSKKQPFSKREWIQTIILLSIFQAFFWYVVFENGQSTSALGYVSFAGTLVSIILAVLAIGYTYGESISSKNKNDALADQISTLGSLIENVEIEAKSLEKIQDISSELSSFIGVYRNDKSQSEQDFKKLSITIESLTRRKDDIASTDREYQFVGPQTKLHKLMQDRTPLDEVCYLILAYMELKQDSKGLHNMNGIILDKLSETPMGLSTEFFQGAVYAQSSLLSNLGFIVFEPNKVNFKLDPELKDYIHDSMVEPMSLSEKDSYSACIKKLHYLVKNIC